MATVKKKTKVKVKEESTLKEKKTKKENEKKESVKAKKENMSAVKDNGGKENEVEKSKGILPSNIEQRLKEEEEKFKGIETEEDVKELVKKQEETLKSIKIAPKKEISFDRGDDVSASPFSLFLKEVSKYETLSPEEERELAMRFKKYGDKKAAKKLVLANLRFVIKIALEYKNWGIPIEDLVSEGIVGLLFAIRKFDPTRGVKFISYTSYWIKAFIHNYILNNFSIVKLGTTQDERKIFANIFKIKDETREEDIREQAERLGVDPDKIKIMDARVRSRDLSLDSPYIDEKSLKLSDILGSDEEDPIVKVEREDSVRFIYKCLSDAMLRLTSQERQVIQQRYLSPKPKTLKELSDELRISKERIRQVEKKAFQKLRNALAQYAKVFRIHELKDKVRKRRKKEETAEAQTKQTKKRKSKKRKRSSSTTKFEGRDFEFL